MVIVISRIFQYITLGQVLLQVLYSKSMIFILQQLIHAYCLGLKVKYFDHKIISVKAQKLIFLIHFQNFIANYYIVNRLITLRVKAIISLFKRLFFQKQSIKIVLLVFYLFQNYLRILCQDKWLWTAPGNDCNIEASYHAHFISLKRICWGFPFQVLTVFQD